MLFLGTLVLTTLLVWKLRNSIQHKPKAYYIGMLVLTLAVIAYYQLHLYEALPKGFTRYVIGPFKRGAVSTALFYLVMIMGALPKNDFVKVLMPIRGELSILAGISVFGHNIIYGIKNFTMLFTAPGEMGTVRLTATLLTLVMLAMLIPLWVTSFPSVRKKMKPKAWKNLQTLAYPFFFLIYCHVMVLYSRKPEAHVFDMIFYTFLWAGYVFCKLKYSHFHAWKTVKA